MKYSPLLVLLLSPRQTISGSTSYNLVYVQEATNTKRQFSYTHYEDFEELPFQRTAGQFGHIGLTVDNNDGFNDYDPNGEIFDKDDLQKHFDYDDVYKNAKYNNHCGDPSYPIKCSSSYGSYGLCKFKFKYTVYLKPT